MKRRIADLVNTFGPKEGPCNICGQVGPLTEDHTPPKSCSGLKAGVLHRLHVQLSDGPVPKGRMVQNGHTYRTLCGRCNNTLLGKNYDPALAHFCAEVRTAYESPGWPLRFSIEIQPQLVMRSVLGHLSAMGVGRNQNGPITQLLRDYLLDAAQPLPPGIRVYYWLYKAGAQVLVRDAAMGWLGTGAEPFAFWLMKFYPLSFLVTFNEPEARVFNLTDLDRFAQEPEAAKHVVPVELYPMVPDTFPEMPRDEDGYAILYGEEAVVAVPPGYLEQLGAARPVKRG